MENNDVKRRIDEITKQITSLQNELNDLNSQYRRNCFDNEKYVGKYFSYEDTWSDDLTIIYCTSGEMRGTTICMKGVGIIFDHFSDTPFMLFVNDMRSNFEFSPIDMMYVREITKEEFLDMVRQKLNNYVDDNLTRIIDESQLPLPEVRGL